MLFHAGVQKKQEQMKKDKARLKQEMAAAMDALKSRQKHGGIIKKDPFADIKEEGTGESEEEKESEDEAGAGAGAGAGADGKPAGTGGNSQLHGVFTQGASRITVTDYDWLF